jgi:hypothetical protein
MASPFHGFRKRQKEILVFLGVICIFTFTVGPVILDYFPMGGGGSAEVQAAVAWKGGELNENELFNLRRIHSLTIEYLDRIVAETVNRGGSPKGAGVNRDRTGRVIEPGIARDDSDLRLVRTLLLAEQAEKIGMEVPDEAIYGFLAQLSDRMLSSQELRSMLTDATNGRLTRDQLFDNLRRELLARNYLRLVASGDVMTPDDAWSYYNRLTRRVTTSILAFPAADYVDRAPQPSKAEVQALYDKHKEQYPLPASPEPGFKQRPLYKFAYFKAGYDKFIDEEKAKISDEEVQKYYEEHKESYKVPELPATKTDATPGDEGAAKTSESPETDPAKTPDLTPPENPSPPGADADAETPAKSEETPEASKTPSPDEGASLPRSTFEVAFLANQDEASQPDADTAEPAESTEAPAADAAKAEQPAEGEKKGAAADDANEKTPEEGAKKEPKYQPLSEVEDDIRRNLASQAARDRMDQALTEARRQVDRYKRAFASYRARVEAGGEAKEPAKPDFQQIAQDLGLEYGETPLVNQLTVGETDLGKTFMFGPGFQQYSFAQIAMGEQATLYQAERIQGLDDFLYWTTEFKESRTPPLEEIRDEVVRAWRLQKAVEIATQEAENAAQKVREAPKETPLAEAAGVDKSKVIQPPAFSWMTSGSMPFGGGAPYMSDVQGVDSPGAAFMETVFGLHPGSVGVAPNEPKTIVYLARLEDETPSDQVRRDLFWQTGLQFNVNLQYVAQMEQQRKIFAWIEEFEKEWGLEWKRPPKTYAG